MKFFWFSIFILIAGFGFFWKREPIPSYGDPPVPQVTKTIKKIPAPVGIPSGPPSSPLSTQPKPPVAEDVTLRLQKIAGLARFTLPTQEARDELIKALSDRNLQSDLGRILQASDRFAYDADQEKLRMNAVSVLGLILKYKDVNHREDVVRWMKQRILEVDFDSMKDIRVKQSVYGDITELLMILKQHDSEAFEELAQRISETNIRVLKTALAASR